MDKVFNKPTQLNVPVLGVCGHSGAGKTTLIARIVAEQKSKGRRICVLKHGTHQFDLDREGKDSYRFFQAGADVQLQNNTELCFREHFDGSANVQQTIQRLAPSYDGILLEGHSQTAAIGKVWLTHPNTADVPDVPGGFEMILERTVDRFQLVNELFESMMKNCFQTSVFSGAVLIGGESRRFGQPKHLVKIDGKTWLERTVDVIAPFVDQIVLVGRGDVPDRCRELPRLWDVPDVAGPVAGIRSLFRWDPLRSWLVMPCDLAELHAPGVAWLVAQRQISYRAILPKLSENAPLEPLFAYYDYRCGPLFEQVDSPRKIAAFNGVVSPVVPPHLTCAWKNFNRNSELPDS